MKIIQTLKSFEINTGSDLQCKKGFILKRKLKVKIIYQNPYGALLKSWVSKASGSAIVLKVDGEFCFYKHSVAEKNQFLFTTVALKLVEKLPKGVNKFGKQSVEQIYCLKGVKQNNY